MHVVHRSTLNNLFFKHNLDSSIFQFCLFTLKRCRHNLPYCVFLRHVVLCFSDVHYTTHRKSKHSERTGIAFKTIPAGEPRVDVLLLACTFPPLFQRKVAEQCVCVIRRKLQEKIKATSTLMQRKTETASVQMSFSEIISVCTYIIHISHFNPELSWICALEPRSAFNWKTEREVISNVGDWLQRIQSSIYTRRKCSQWDEV